MEPQAALANQRRLVLAFSLGLLAILVFRILYIFLVPMVWAGILAYVSWPLYEPMRSRLGSYRRLAPLLMSLFMALVLVLPLVWVVLILKTELGMLYQQLTQRVGQGPVVLPPALHNIPGLGAQAEEFINSAIQNSDSLSTRLRSWTTYGASHIGGIADLVGKNIAKMIFALFTLFFCYRDGEIAMDQIRTVLRRVMGPRVDGYIQAMGDTTRAVLWGLGVTALGQGLLALLGFLMAGVPSPVFLATVTMILALVPFGPVLSWGGVCGWLVLQGDYLPAVGLLIYAALLSAWVDSWLRPLVIANASNIPFVLVVFGVLGGLAAFGMIGLFLGPVILAVAMSVWREWLADAVQGPEGKGA